MTIREALERCDRVQSNDVPVITKTEWLSELDRKIFSELLKPRGLIDSFSGYTSASPLDTVLLAPAEYEEIYILYLQMQLDFINAETGRLSNSTALFNRLYYEMGNAVNRDNAVVKNTSLKAGALYV